MKVRPYLLLVVALAVSTRTGAQTAFFDQITQTEGLPAEQVLCLHQTPDGFVWIGTENGLARHEGNAIRVFHSDRTDPHSLPNEQVQDIVSDAQGRLWFATAGGIARYRRPTGDFDRYFIHAEGVADVLADRVSDLLPEPDGSGLWAITEAGLYRVTTSDGHAEPMDEAMNASGGVAKVFRHSIVADSIRQGVWFGTEQGLRFFDRRTGSFFGPKHDPLGWNCFHEGPASCPNMAADGAIWYFDIDARELVRILPGTTDVQRWPAFRTRPYAYTPQFMAFTKDGRLWISTWTYDLIVLDPATGSWSRFRHDDADPASLIHENVKALLEDRDGTVWIGTRAGISLMVKQRQCMRVLPAIAGTSVSALLALPGDALAIGTFGAGLWISDSLGGGVSGMRRMAIDGNGMRPVASSAVDVLTRDRYGGSRTVIGNRLGTLDPLHARIHLDDKLLQALPELVKERTTFVEEDRHRRLWIGTWDHGILRCDLDGSRMERLGTMRHAEVAMPVNSMICCLMASSGDVWVGMNGGGGLARFPADGSAPTFYGNGAGDTGLGNAVVDCLAEGADGAIWIGTHDGGIDRLAPSGRLEHFSFKDGLPGSRIHALAVDRTGGLWASTIGGIALLRKGTSHFVEVPLPQGLRKKDLGGALCLMESGSVVFGIAERLLVIDPARMPASAAPDARIVCVTTRSGTNWAPSPGMPLDLPHDGRELSVQAGAITFHDAARTVFSFRVPDIDDRWSVIGHEGRIDLNDLPAGAHRVEVRASVDGLNWSAVPALMNVHVLPPLWATWWFRVFSTAVLASLVVLGFRSYLRARLRKERELAERERVLLQERMRIAGDMHDDLGAGLSALKLRSEMALRVERDPLKKQQLGSLAGTAGELIESMRQIIWTMDGDQVGLEDLVTYSGNYARKYCEENGLGLTVSATGPWPAISLTMEQRRNMFLVIKEALHNVVKHAHSTRIDLRMTYSGGLRVELADDGIGMPQGADLGQGNGLRNMRKRIAILGGSFQAEGGNGTSIRFHVALGED
jgi:signal transduction histidine kinase/ligand-binding sensor domain-containing protein